MDSRRATTTAALIVLVCFFLPWIQVSCGATKDTASGIDLARGGSGALWLIPLLMLALLFVALRVWKERRELSTLVSLVSGLVSAYLMNRERLKFEDGSGFLRVGVTGWFWLGLGSSVAIVIVAAYRLLTRRKSSSPV
jgi:asparagine N-glycosylation enzyme membrane subunit Stt3